MRVRSAVAVTAVLGTAVGLVPVLGGVAGAGEAEPAEEVVLPARERVEPRNAALLTVGTTGYLQSAEGHAGTLWTDFATGVGRPLQALSSTLPYEGLTARSYPAKGAEPARVLLTDLGSGTTVTVPLGPKDSWTRAYTKDTVTVLRRGADAAAPLRLVTLRMVDGKAQERDIQGLPAQAGGIATRFQDAHGAVVHLTATDSSSGFYVLDYAAATLRRIPTASAQNAIGISRKHLLFRTPSSAPTGKVVLFSRADPGAPPAEVVLPNASSVAAVGDWLLAALAAPDKESPGGPLLAYPLSGGAPKQLLAHARRAAPLNEPATSVLAIGGTSAADWAVRRITVTADGSPAVTTVRTLPPAPARVESLVLGGSTLGYAGAVEGSMLPGLHTRELSPTGTPTAGAARLNQRFDSSPAYTFALGNGRVAYSMGNGVVSPNPDGTLRVTPVPAMGWLRDASGRYAVANGEGGQQYVVDMEATTGNQLVLTREVSAVALWGDTLWKPAAEEGTVESYNLKTKVTGPAVNLVGGCTPERLQAVGRWIYWECDPFRTGVYDTVAKKRVQGAGGANAKLGDGFLVRRDDDGRLLLTDFTKATPEAETISAPGTTQWTVDAYGGHVAFADAEQRIHLKPTGVARQAVTVLESEVDETAVARNAADPWNARFFLSRPAARWTLTFTNDRTGTTVATRTGTAREGTQITPVWDGKDDKGNVAPSGRHTWTLTVDPGDGTGAREVTSGTLGLSGTSPVKIWHRNGPK
ncbi:FlgD immunoglobulin-like domain containing protein [Streptomyces sp. NPDC051561]|uniref:FlgD immunoglobulin-like domain containing protein n=1 Tax=Streptomyces sp. NPDC051561 TaxID=3365658 RepID=UPI0037A2C805